MLLFFLLFFPNLFFLFLYSFLLFLSLLRKNYLLDSNGCFFRLINKSYDKFS